MIIEPLRGRVRIKPDILNRVGLIFIPDQVVDREGKDRKLARTGVVMQMGAPALDRKGREVPPGFEPGSRVVYVYGQITGDGHDAWCAQSEVLGVFE